MKSQSSFTSSLLAALAMLRGGLGAQHNIVPTGERRRAGRSAGAYGRGLRNHFTEKQRQKLPKVGVLRDEHGAFTLVGGDSSRRIDRPKGPRRKWLAGISARRGY